MYKKHQPQVTATIGSHTKYMHMHDFVHVSLTRLDGQQVNLKILDKNCVAINYNFGNEKTHIF